LKETTGLEGKCVGERAKLDEASEGFVREGASVLANSKTPINALLNPLLRGEMRSGNSEAG